MAQRVQIKDEVKWKPSPRVRLTKPIEIYEWGGAYEGWARKWVSKNFWRVRELFGGEDDALQECALIFVRCCNSYATRVDNPAWMMSLFKTAVRNDWHTFAQRDGNMRSVPVPDDLDVVDYNHGPFVAALSNVSDELKQVLKAIASSPTDFIDMLFYGAEQTRSADPTIAAQATTIINRRIRRLLGITNTAADIVSELRELLE